MEHKDTKSQSFYCPRMIRKLNDDDNDDDDLLSTEDTEDTEILTITMTMTFYMKHLCRWHFCVPSMPITAESKLSLLIAI